MHRQARNFVRRFATQLPVSVIEIGSRNINGTIRDLFPNAKWTGIDLRPGPMVDVVADGATWKPDSLADFVICCEVLEHCEPWAMLLKNAATMLKPGGRLIVTCAGPHRKPHSAIDGSPNLQPGEHYQNLTTAMIAPVLLASRITADFLEYRHEECDTRASGILAAD